jgi:hypothetical protein
MGTDVRFGSERTFLRLAASFFFADEAVTFFVLIEKTQVCLHI